MTLWIYEYYVRVFEVNMMMIHDRIFKSTILSYLLSTIST